ncbi:hypothetical protein QVD17_30751 [Tagetes erecta]|uniref:Uncharacterized protein n=1 Tax=Tagetes erecta TaxID=13708 RepID=A0AAD8K8H4_TARER|nr:hypothetical protein QVD17_30751 [Tagetes erecta]
MLIKSRLVIHIQSKSKVFKELDDWRIAMIGWERGSVSVVPLQACYNWMDFNKRLEDLSEAGLEALLEQVEEEKRLANMD